MDAERLGDIGTLTGSAADYAPIWAAADCGISLSDIEEHWTFDRLAAFSEYRRMKADYKSAWTHFYREEGRRKKDG